MIFFRARRRAAAPASCPASQGRRRPFRSVSTTMFAKLALFLALVALAFAQTPAPVNYGVRVLERSSPVLMSCQIVCLYLMFNPSTIDPSGLRRLRPRSGSYIAECDATSPAVTFVNFPERDCAGVATKKQDALNQCLVEGVVFSWKSSCNATNIMFENFVGTSCGGPSLVTRTYQTGLCRNCNNAACKD